MRSKDYVVVKVTPDQKSYTFWVVEPEVGLSLTADGVPVEPPYVFRNRTTSLTDLETAIGLEMPGLTADGQSVTPPGPVTLSSTLHGLGTLVVGAALESQLDALLDGESDLSSLAVLVSDISASVSGAGTIILNANELAQIEKTLSGSSSIFADVDSNPGPQQIFATLSGVGAVSVTAILGSGALAASISGAGSMSARTVLREAISKSFSGTGTLTVDIISHPGGISIGATLSGAGSIDAQAQAGTIFNVNASVSGNDVTVTASTVNLTAASKVFGVEYGDGPSGVLTLSKNGPGTNKNQSITIGLLDGVVPGHTLSYRAYYNLTTGDPYNTRRYGFIQTVDVPTGSVNLVAALSAIGSITANLQAGTLFNVQASQSSGSVTVLADTSVDLSAASKVFGVEYGDGAGGVYTKAKNGVGAALHQSITIGKLDDVIAGHTLSYRPYYNLTAGDPYTTRVYGQSGEIAVS